MQIVIDIPEEAYKQIMEFGFLENTHGKICYKAIKNGTVLPEHGRLIDIDNIQEIQLEDSLTLLTHKKGDEVDWHIDAPTILEATKESEE